MNRDAAYVARELGKTENWVRRNAHRLPHHRFGRSYMFTDEDIALILKSGEHRPVAPADDDGELRPSGAKRNRP